MSSNRYTEETEKLRRTNTRIIQSEILRTIATEPKKLNFKTFCKLDFDQKFPDMLLAVVFSLFDEIGTNFLTDYYSISKYKISIVNDVVNIMRPVNVCKDFIKIAKSHYQVIKPDVKNYKPRNENFTKELIKGAVVSFMLGCNAEYLCEYRQLGATASSLKSASLMILGKHCPLLMDRIFMHIVIPNTLKITL